MFDGESVCSPLLLMANWMDDNVVEFKKFIHVQQMLQHHSQSLEEEGDDATLIAAAFMLYATEEAQEIHALH